LVGNSIFQELSALAAPWIASIGESGERKAETIPVSVSTLEIVGLDFAPMNLDAFAAVRDSNAISEYAISFREALASAASAPDLERSLIGLMIEAMHREEIANKVSSGLSTTGSMLEVAGLVRAVGTVAGLAGMAADAGKRASDAAARKHSWYLIGARMQEVAVREFLKKRSESTKDAS
jgi:hypothetical protein